MNNSSNIKTPMEFMQIPVEYMFMKDYIEFCKNNLKKWNYEIPISEKEIPLVFWKCYYRRVPIFKRSIVRAKDFSFPQEMSKLAKDALIELERKNELGEDINQYLSSRILDNNRPEFNDNLLNEWGIHHFHLGKGINHKGMVNRSSWLLFAFVTNNTFYEICIESHHKQHLWTQENLIFRIHENWPWLLEPFICKGCIATSSIVDASGRQSLWNAHINSAIQLPDGQILLGPGFGMMSDGTSCRAVMQNDAIFHEIKKLEEIYKSRSHEIQSFAYNNSKHVIRKIYVHLFFDLYSLFKSIYISINEP